MLFVVLFGTVSFVKAQNTSADTAKVVLKTQLDSVSYAMGASIAQDLKRRGISALNYAILERGIKDVFAGRATRLNQQEGQQCIMDYLTYVKKKTSESFLVESNRFLEEIKNKKGIISTASGLCYEVITAAQGAKPLVTDQVTVHYRGTLSNGRPFDSSYERNQPFTTMLNQVIPGWTEGVQLMTVGSKYRFYIPYQLGYGENGAGEDIPPYSVLIFEIELIKIGN